MGTEITIEIPEEKEVEGEAEIVEETKDAVIETALDVLEVAKDIAEEIAPDVETETKLARIMERLEVINADISALAIAITDIKALLVLQVGAEESEAEEIAEEVSEEIAEEIVEEIKEEVPVAETPQIRKKKSVKWL